MKTIKEHNEEKEKLFVGTVSFTPKQKQEWIPIDIMCPCGCKGPLLTERWLFGRSFNYKKPIRCQATGKPGMLHYFDALRDIIKSVEWD